MAEISSTGDQMLAVLEAVAEQGPLSAAGVARQLDVNRTVAHRLLTTLHRRAYLRRDSEGAYAIGPTVSKLAQVDSTGLLGAVAPVTQALAERTGESVVVHVPDGDRAVVLYSAAGNQHLVRVSHDVGSHHSLAEGASGRAILAFAEPGAREAILDTVEDRTLLSRRLNEAEKLGYALSHDELQAGVHGAAVPIRGEDGHAVASLALVVPSSRADALLQWPEALLAARDEIEKTI
jgi:DNA-binding IclR family transcriptional regulator